MAHSAKEVSEYFYNEPENAKKYRKEIDHALEPRAHQHRGLFMKTERDDARVRREGRERQYG